MSNEDKDLVTIEVELIHQTDKAYLIHTGDEDKKVWLPKSVCEFDADDNTITLPEFIAIDRGLI